MALGAIRLLFPLLLLLLVRDAADLVVSCAEIPCSAIEGIVDIDLGDYHDQDGGPVVVQDCQWIDAVIAFNFNQPIAMVVRNTGLGGGQLTFTLSHASNGSSILIDGASTVGSKNSFTFIANELAHITIVVRNSTLFAKESAVSIVATSITNVSLTIVDSKIVVENPVSGTAQAAAIFNYDYNRVHTIVSSSVSVQNSTISAIGATDAASVGITFTDGNSFILATSNVQFSAVDSTITAGGSLFAAAALSLTICMYMDNGGSAAVSASGVSFIASRSNVTASSRACAGSVGISSTFRTVTQFTVEDLIVESSDSVVDANATAYTASSMGVAVFSTDSVQMNFANLALQCSNSAVTSTGFRLASAMSVSSLAYLRSEIALDVDGLFIHGTACNVACRSGFQNAASMGIASLSHNTMMALRNISISGIDCASEAISDGPVAASMGVVSYSYFVSNVTLVSASLTSVHTNISTTAVKDVSASMGIVSLGGSKGELRRSSLTASSVEIISVESIVTSQSRNSAASAGLLCVAEYGGVIMTITNVLIEVYQCHVDATAQYRISAASIVSCAAVTDSSVALYSTFVDISESKVASTAVGVHSSASGGISIYSQHQSNTTMVDVSLQCTSSSLSSSVMDGSAALGISVIVNAQDQLSLVASNLTIIGLSSNFSVGDRHGAAAVGIALYTDDAAAVSSFLDHITMHCAECNSNVSAGMLGNSAVTLGVSQFGGGSNLYAVNVSISAVNSMMSVLSKRSAACLGISGFSNSRERPSVVVVTGAEVDVDHSTVTVRTYLSSVTLGVSSHTVDDQNFGSESSINFTSSVVYATGGSNLSATAGISGAICGGVASIGSVVYTAIANVTMLVGNSTLRAAAENSAAALAILSSVPPATIRNPMTATTIVNDISLCSDGSSIYAVAECPIAAMALSSVAMGGYESVASMLEASGVSMHASNSTVVATFVSAALSNVLHAASLSVFVAGYTQSTKAEGISISSDSSEVSARSSYSTVSMGVLTVTTGGGQKGPTALANVQIFSEHSVTTAVSILLDIAVCHGVATFNGVNFTARDIMLIGRNSSVIAEAARQGLGMAFGAFATEQSEFLNVAVFCLRCLLSVVVTNQQSVAASIYSSASNYPFSANLITENVTIYVVDSDCRSESAAVSASCYGIVAFSFTDNATITASNVTLYAENSVAVATTSTKNPTATVTLGIAACANKEFISTVVANGLMIAAIDCAQLEAIADDLSSVATAGVSSKDVQVFSITLLSCNSTLASSTKTELGVTFGVTVFRNAQPAVWVVKNSRISGTKCFNMPLPPDGVGVISNASIQCAHAGWTVRNGEIFVVDWTVVGQPCGDECLNATFPSETTNDEPPDAVLRRPCSYYNPSPVVPPRLEVSCSSPFLQKRPSSPLPNKRTQSHSLVDSLTHTPSASTSVIDESSSSISVTQPQKNSTTISHSTTAQLKRNDGEESHTMTETAIDADVVSVSQSNDDPAATSAPHGANATNETTGVPLNTSFPSATGSRSTSSPAAAVLSVVIDGDVAEVVATTGSISTIGAGLVHPSAASQYARLAAVLRSILCVLEEGVDSPGRLEHPLQMPIGSGPRPQYTGACLTDSLLLLVLHAVQFSLGKFIHADRASKRVLSFVRVQGIVTVLAAAYFLPNSLSAASIIMNGSGRSTVELIVAIVAICVWVGLVAWPLWATLKLAVYVKWTVALQPGKVDVTYKCHEMSSPFIHVYAKFFDDTRDPSSILCRLVFFEEVISTSVCAFLSGIQPSDSSCSYVLGAILTISALHLLYTAWLRPFNRRLATVFSVASALVVVGICVLGIVVLRDPSKESLLAYPLLLQNGIFFLQLATECVWAYIVASKRDVMRQQGEAARFLLDPEDDEEGIEMPSADARANPLDAAI